MRILSRIFQAGYGSVEDKSSVADEVVNKYGHDLLKSNMVEHRLYNACESLSVRGCLKPIMIMFRTSS